MRERVKTTLGGKHCISVRVRPLTGVEVFQMQGWDISDFISMQPSSLPCVELLNNMGGNAFSACACLPLVFATILVVEAGAFRSATSLPPVVASSESEEAEYSLAIDS